MLTKSDVKGVMEEVGKVIEINHICGNFSTHTKEYCSKGAYDRDN